MSRSHCDALRNETVEFCYVVVASVNWIIIVTCSVFITSVGDCSAAVSRRKFNSHRPTHACSVFVVETPRDSRRLSPSQFTRTYHDKSRQLSRRREHLHYVSVWEVEVCYVRLLWVRCVCVEGSCVHGGHWRSVVLGRLHVTDVSLSTAALAAVEPAPQQRQIVVVTWPATTPRSAHHYQYHHYQQNDYQQLEYEQQEEASSELSTSSCVVSAQLCWHYNVPHRYRRYTVVLRLYCFFFTHGLCNQLRFVQYWLTDS